jgi:uncharacterized protein
MLKFFLGVISVLTVLAALPAQAEENKVVRLISVTGQGEIRTVPDAATVNIGVVTNAATAREALDANSKNMTALIDMLKKAGVDARDLSTSNFSVGPRYDYNNNTQPPKILGYDVSNQVTVVVRKIDELGELLDVAVSTGSNQINGVSFMVSKPDGALDEARKLAVADARSKAEIYAAAGGFKLGTIVSLSEGVSVQQPQPHVLKQARAADAAVPIAEGEQTLTVEINVNYEIE